MKTTDRRTRQGNLIHGRGVLLAAACLMFAVSSTGHAQKGMGDPIGMVRQGLEPAVISLSGLVQSVETHPCANTTGRAVVGTHIMLQGDDGKEYNLHLGPADAVSALVEGLAPGARIEVVAFQTAKMPENHHVVTTLIHEGEIVELRGAGLQPVWSQQRRGLAGSRRGIGRIASPEAAGRFEYSLRQEFQPRRLRLRGGRGQGFGRANCPRYPYR